MKRLCAMAALSLCLHTPAWAAPNPDAVNPAPVPLIQVNMYKLENGEKKSRVSIAARDRGSAETFNVLQGKTFERNFFNPEILDNGKVAVRLHQCSGTVSDEQLQNPSSIECVPGKMNRIYFETSYNQPAIVEAIGPNGEKQEYYLFVEKLSASESPAATL
jgi:hypothetical protein